MPLYDYRCGTCGAKREVQLKLADLDSTFVKCLQCSAGMARCLSAPQVVKDYPGYTCPITGNWIEGRKAHKENLTRHDCRVREPGESAYHARQRAAAEREFDKAIDQTVEATVHNMDSDKRERLFAEVEAGATVSPVRQSPKG